MPATPTRPRLEQIRFTSSKTGTHNIDTYLESAEIGNRTLASLLADLFDETNNGDFRTDIFDFRSSNGVLQFRVGEFLDAETGWQDVDFRTLVGKDAVTFPMATSYPSQSLFILGTKLYMSNKTIQYASQSAFDAGEAASEVTELFDAASLTTAELDAAVAAAQTAQAAAENATINNADFTALVARLTDIQNLANPAANRTALEAFGDSYTANPSSNAITGLNNIGNTATAVTGLTNLKDSATPLANLSNSSAEINRLGATQNIVDAIELLGDNQTRIDAIDALGDATTSAAIDRLNQTDTSSPNSPQDTTADYIDALGTATMVAKLVALHNALADINALAARSTEISALGSRTTEIDALYAIRADIDAIGDTATLNDISTVAGISTTHVASINQDLGTGDSPAFDAIAVDTIDPDPDNIGTPLTIAGNLIVSGTTTTVNSNTVNIGDSIITLNSDETGVPSQNAGFEVERGTSANVSFVWDEANGRFTTNSQDLAAGTFIGPLTGAVTGNADTATKWATPRTVQLQGDVTGTASNVDGSANITINTSMANGSVDLGTHTFGNYVEAGATSGNGLSGSLSAAGGTFTVTSNATDANTPSTIVFRDASGDFAAGTITADGLNLGDNEKILLGTGGYLEVYANGGTSYIRETGTGNLRIAGNTVQLTDASFSKYFQGSGGTSYFYHNDFQKLATTSTGVGVTGTITADGLTVDGDVLLSDNANYTDQTVKISTGGATIGNKSILAFADQRGSETAQIIGYNSAYGSGLDKVVEINVDGLTSARFWDGGDISFYEDTGTTAKFFWDASEEALGIGTTSPTQELHVQAGTGLEADIRLSGNAGASSYLDLFHNAGAAGMWNASNTPLQFGTNATERMRITSSGNLLVGKTTTAFGTDGITLASVGELNVTRDGAVPVSLNRRNSDGNILNFAKDGATVGSIASVGGSDIKVVLSSDGDQYITGNAASNYMAFSAANAERMRITSSGNVGIGTTTPATALDVTGTVTADTFSFANWTVTESGGSLYFATGGTNKMKLDASGNLQVVGNVESNATIS